MSQASQEYIPLPFPPERADLPALEMALEQNTVTLPPDGFVLSGEHIRETQGINTLGARAIITLAPHDNFPPEQLLVVEHDMDAPAMSTPPGITAPDTRPIHPYAVIPMGIRGMHYKWLPATMSAAIIRDPNGTHIDFDGPSPENVGENLVLTPSPDGSLSIRGMTPKSAWLSVPTDAVVTPPDYDRTIAGTLDGTRKLARTALR